MAQSESEASNLERVAIKNLVHATSSDPNSKERSAGETEKPAFPSKPKAPQHRWTPEDDQKVLAWTAEHGPRRWTQLSAAVFSGARSPAQLRARYIDVLHPNRVDKAWTAEEDSLLLELVRQNGSHWTLIAENLEGRVANDAKNRFRLLMRAQRSDRRSASSV
mmetsp:Transcript_6698/g.17995  ORF Transcript_6698/g.17995 Transcript_6698/m.17995 type:complete len:163 (+) Transcript_6698:191-679(+)|eukprot:CAMPEP_0185837946 /NCGR_PEP_ID=MMETSP1353-20130828/12262_1 /TAXON_ID=1077150 /ORGANISM="Erythrolobus australicus, Strain CCMP3124" /LENGTH=162 /DNA_ID=CAMNT_0028536937 /DNA_START=182 /DNA_END=670 /DNA_ORIENTATION=+